MALEYQEAAREWRALLAANGGTAERFVDEHFDAAMALAVVLFSRAENLSESQSDAIRAVCRSDNDEQVFLSAVSALRRLLDVVVRDHMAFLLPDHALPTGDATASSASQKETLVHQQSLRDLLPPAFQQRFRQKLFDHWEELNDAVSANKLSLPRVQQLDWKVTRASSASAQSMVLMRVQTSDGGSRCFQVPLREFHRLRYSAAKVLQEMNQVEAHPMMRLTNMEQQMNSASREATASLSGARANRVP